MFLGRYEHTLDEKNRMTIPSRFREQLAHGVVLSPGLDGCLWLYTPDEYEKIASRIDELPWTEPDSRKFVRAMYSGAIDMTPDKQGRIRIPEYLLDRAGIESEVYIIGIHSKVEIWARDRWIEKQTSVEEDPEGLAQQMTSYGVL